ncbi:MAG TPA: SPFH domain-containing protein [Chthonomonadales bacterium]|nr:SPFH domain-containing protein [Chthonomonadales bacterium]
MPALPLDQFFLYLGAGAVVLVVLVFTIITIYRAMYRKVGPNEVLVISGGKGEVLMDEGGDRRRIGFRIVKGGGSLVNPLTERVEVMSLELITLDIVTPEMYTKMGVPIKVDGVAQIKVRGDDVSIRTAAEQFLNKTREEIKQIAYQTVAGHLRAILGTLTVEEVYAAHDTFAQRVAEVSAGDLTNMGLEVVSFTIREISDSRGYLEAIGKTRIAQVKRDAQIGEAEANRDATIRSAQAQQAASIAKFEAETKIAEADRDYSLKVQDYNAAVNQKKAEADLAYDLQRYKTEQAVREQAVQVQIVEKMKQTELEDKEISRRERELIATVQRPAEAERTRIQTIAEAEQFRLKATALGQAEASKTTGFAQADVVQKSGQSEAEANRVRGLVEAEVNKAKALADATAIEARGLAEAKAIEAKGLAEAESVRARGLAEATAMSKRAEAFRAYNEAAVAQMIIEKLPAMAQAVAAPLSRVDKIVMVNTSGEGVGASRLTHEVTGIMAQVPPVIEAMTGLKLSDLVSRVPAVSGSAATKGAATETAEEATAATPPAAGASTSPTP